MKKILLLTIMMLLNLSSTCFAIDLDELRWVKVYETDTDKCYIDTESVKFDDNLKRIFKCNKKTSLCICMVP